MSIARYLYRFDDICPTMNWAIWEEIEAQFIRFDIRPILAVVPVNQDAELVIDPPKEGFWERVRRWQAMGWTIALHGYQHRYVNNNPGILRLTCRSEFAGLPRAEQEAKLKRGIAIFALHGIRVDAWVAPSHTFGRKHVDLLSDLGVSLIVDGLLRRPFTAKGGMTWITQQLWRFHKKNSGTWTICCHHNDWTKIGLEKFLKNVAEHASQITNVDAVLKAYSGRGQTIFNRWSGLYRLIWVHRIRRFLILHVFRRHA